MTITTATTTPSSTTAATGGARQIPIVCPGHTRPLAELQFLQVDEAASPSDDDGGGGGEPTSLLVSACHDKMPMLRNGLTGDWIGTWSGHKGAVWSCRLDPSGNLAATASGDFSVKVWDAITGQALWDLPHKHIVKSNDFSPDSSKLATGGHEGLLRIYDFAHETLLQQREGGSGKSKNQKDPILEIPQAMLPGDESSSSSNKNKKIFITKLSWYDNSIVMAAGSDGCIRFWKVDDDDSSDVGPPTEPMQVLKVDAEVRDMEFSPHLQILTVAAGSKVYFFHTHHHHQTSSSSSSSLIHAYPMPNIHYFQNEGGASLHPSGHKFVAGGCDLWVRVFDFATGTELECHKGHHGPIRCVRYAPDGKTYATGSEDGTIRLWKTDVMATSTNTAAPAPAAAAES